MLIGPLTYLRLAEMEDGSDPLALLPRLLPAYDEIVARLVAAGADCDRASTSRYWSGPG